MGKKSETRFIEGKMTPWKMTSEPLAYMVGIRWLWYFDAKSKR